MPTDPRFVVTAAGDTFHLVAALHSGDYKVRNNAGTLFVLSAHVIVGVR